MRLTAQARAEKHYPHRGEPRVDCPTCGAKYTFYTVSLTGVAWQSCVCGEQPVPVKRLGDTVLHDQAQRLGEQLTKWFQNSKRRDVKPAPRPVGGHPWTNRGTV